MLLVFSHKLTNRQIQSAKKYFNVVSFKCLPSKLQQVWSNIPPDKKDINPYVEEIIQWIKNTANKGDIVLVQGDFGATYKIVRYCKHKGYKAVYSTTKREAIEKETENSTISITHKVSHVIFREY